MKGSWHGGKGSGRRKNSNDEMYRDNWDKIFKQKENNKNVEKSAVGVACPSQSSTT